jgi:hypothetical protein
MINPNDQAFPAIAPNDEGWNGMTKREYFAALAMQSLLTSTFANPEEAAKQAVEAADALIEQLNKLTTSN